ncbi:hypothetical protein QBD01_002596 [Ochrobactrum sp. 19YEA23]|uniref:VirK family protein n=1 Tax=Ochrobactrum sp. 19YEA23 TaxID=3039854 RepID=UPI0024797FA0|nr:hypothetical protein [Ochrobactrum sp. 19YEA23]
MRRKIGTLLMVIGMSGIAPAHAAESIDQFATLKQHLYSGQRTTSLLELDKCEQTSGTKQRPEGFTGGLVIQAFLSKPAPDEAIVYAHNHETVSDDTPLQQFVRYRVLPDETATIIIWRFSPKTHDQIGETRIFKCKLGEGLKFAYDKGA